MNRAIPAANMERRVASNARQSKAVWAIFIALCLVVQTFSAARAMGSERVMLDQFGNPLCVTASDDHGAPIPHGSLTDCCKLACSGAATAFGEPPALFEPIPASSWLWLRAEPFPEAPRPAALRRTPCQPRAPPLTA